MTIYKPQKEAAQPITMNTMPVFGLHALRKTEPLHQRVITREGILCRCQWLTMKLSLLTILTP